MHPSIDSGAVPPMQTINALSLSHRFLQDWVRPGSLCIDATAGRGRDTVFLCGLTGVGGTVLAFDIQQEALDSTAALLQEQGWHNARLILDSHENLSAYAQPGTVDCVVFNLGWLPGGDHDIHTQPHSSIAAIAQGLDLLRPGGVMSICIYFGRNNGYAERDAVLAYLEALDPTVYTVIVSRFVNRRGDVAIPVSIVKQNR